MVRRIVTQLALVLASLSCRALADCQCGYSTTVSGSDDPVVFTDLLETDFTQFANISYNKDWVRQQFTKSDEAARGKYGEKFEVSNVATHVDDSKKPKKYFAADAAAAIGPDNGLQLLVKSQVEDNVVPTAEIDSRRVDMFHGSFRASIKLTEVAGTCAAFFWYFNDTQEIDMEFLSREFNPENSSFPVNLVLQSRQSLEAGFDASKTDTFVRANLPFNPTDDFHEYRIDYLPDHVYFYADGKLLAQMEGPSVPETDGHLVLQHWSNGNELWSGGPPNQDTVLTVRYVKAYFNSSDTQRDKDFQKTCKGEFTKDGAVCSIPDIASDPGAKDFFFINDAKKVKNQNVTMPGEENPATSLRPGASSALGWTLIVFSTLAACLW